MQALREENSLKNIKYLTVQTLFTDIVCRCFVLYLVSYLPFLIFSLFLTMHINNLNAY